MNPLAFLSPGRWLGVLGLALALWAGLAWWHADGVRAGRAQVQASWDIDRDQRIETAATAAQLYINHTSQLTAKVTKASDDIKTEKARSRGLESALRGTDDRMRAALAAHATGGVAAADDTVAACRDRAATADDVLADVLRDCRAITKAATDHAADVRGMLAAWPTNLKGTTP